MAQKEVTEELAKLLILLNKEKEEDLRQYQIRMQNTSFAERRKSGVLWYPVRIEKSTFSSAEQLIIRVSRSPEHKDAHLFQSGKLVSFFSEGHENSEDSETISGVVNNVTDHEMLITLNADDHPQWIYDGKLGVQLLFDENAYREMEKGITHLIARTSDRQEELKQILLGHKSARFEDRPEIHLSELNSSQNKALNMVLASKDLAIIHGPPGTGKTTTLIQAIIQTLKNETQVLVCAPSNAAVDLLVEKLGELQVGVVRIGHPARVNNEVLSRTLDARITSHKQYKTLKSLRKSAEEYRSLGRKYKRNFTHTEREQRRLLLSEAKKFRAEANLLSDYIKEDILSGSRVIATTLIGANNMALQKMHFSTVFIDEAAQGMEPAAWLPIIKSDRVVFAGDHCQLPPTIKSFEAAREGLEITLFEKAIQRNSAEVMLTEQYRMHEQIMNFPNQHFYNNDLTANVAVKEHTLFPDDLPVEFIDTAGCGFFEQTNPESKSAMNPEEMNLLFKHLMHYLENMKALNLISEIRDIGIISPYKAQVSLMQEAFPHQGTGGDSDMPQIAINTIDSFQGQERDIIYISLVRSNETGEIGFLKDTRRMNVAMTRARKKLVIFGDSSTIGNHHFYAGLLDYIDTLGAYKSGFEYLYD